MTFKDPFQPRPFCDSMKWGVKLCQKHGNKEKGNLEQGPTAHHPAFWVSARLANVVSCLEQLLSASSFALLWNTIKQRDYSSREQLCWNLKTRNYTTTKRLKLAFPIINLVIIFPVNLIFGDLQEMSNEFMRRRAVDQKNIKMGLLLKFQK